MPVMLWQLPGGHIQDTLDPFRDMKHISTFANYLFDTSYIDAKFNNAINLEFTIGQHAHNYTVNTASPLVSKDYLMAQDYNWYTPKINELIDAGVFSIHWMSYTYPSVGVYVDIDDKGWLSKTLDSYIDPYSK